MKGNISWVNELAVKDGKLETFRELMEEMVSGTPPRTTENASRSRYSGRNRAMTSAVATDTSEGLMTAAFPPEIAAISGDNVSITG